MSKKSIIWFVIISIIGFGVIYIGINRPFRSNQAYQYNENEGIFIFYETEDEELYRELLPDEFDIPDEMLVHLFVMDLYDIDSDAEPYKEMSISLLAKLDGEDIWHCIYMPVASEESMMAGQIGLGLPKTIGNIEFIRDNGAYTGTILDEQNRSGSITVNTTNYNMSLAEEEQIKMFMDIPKINILDGEFVQMTTKGGQVNIIEVVEEYPDLIYLQGGAVTIEFDSRDSNIPHPFDLVPTEIVAAYFLHNEIPFSLDRVG